MDPIKINVSTKPDSAKTTSSSTPSKPAAPKPVSKNSNNVAATKPAASTSATSSPSTASTSAGSSATKPAPSGVMGSVQTAPNLNGGGLLGFVGSHRKRLLIALGVLIVVPTAVWGYMAYSKPPKPVAKVLQTPMPTPTPAPRTKASPLTGVEVTTALADRPITAVVIENHPDARPQSGLSQAGVVYEALAEGGITRFLAFYLENRPPQLGPVRSIRTYFVDWALEFNAPVAHVGGNADAVDLIGPLRMKDMNQFAEAASFYRTTDRYAPHNAYTSSDLLDALENKLNYNKPATFKPSPRTDKDTPTNSPAHGNIHIDYSYNGYQVDYRYDPSSNSYLRFLAGAPHVDRNDGQQIKVKNVVVEYMPTSYGTTRAGEQTVIMGTPGSGKAVVFRDGQAIEGTWSKAVHTDRTKLLDAAGKEIPLNKGNTWYSIVPTTKTVSY